MREFEGKTVIVTGGGAGIGRASAVGFAKRGAKHVVVNARGASCEDAKREIEALGCKCTAVQGDIGREETIEALFRAAEDVDILVTSAGYVPAGDVLNTDMADWDIAFDTNVKSVFLCCREAVRRMKGRGGAIVNVASLAGLHGVKNRTLYATTKGAVLAMTKSLALEYLRDGIRVNAVCPGTVLSPSVQRRIDNSEDPEAMMRMFVARQPGGRLGTPEEIAEAVLFMASPANTFTTGEFLVCDGGANA